MLKKYKSKVSFILLAFITILFFGPVVHTIREGKFYTEDLIALIILDVVYLFILSLFFGTEYTIDKDRLKIKCGPFYGKSINIYDIKEISKTNSIIASPAPSFDRIEIKYGNIDSIIISPKHKHQFVEDLESINPNIQNNLEKEEDY